MKYFVHIYAVCRRRVEVEAGSQQEAVKKANQMDMDELFTHRRGSLDEVEYAEQVLDFLVDEDGDKEHEKSQVWKIDPDGQIIPSSLG